MPLKKTKFFTSILYIDSYYENKLVVVLLTNRVHPTRDMVGIYGIRREFHTEIAKALIN